MVPAPNMLNETFEEFEDGPRSVLGQGRIWCIEVNEKEGVQISRDYFELNLRLSQNV